MGTTVRRIGIGAAVLVPLAAVGVGGAYAAGLLRPAAPDYRIVEVTRGSVSEVVDLTGSVTRVNQASATFPTAGTATWLDVEVGEKVTKGQRLARIERLPLQVELVKAESELTKARATYQEDVKAAEDAAKQEREAKQQKKATKPSSAPPSDKQNQGNDPEPPPKQKEPKRDKGAQPINQVPLAALIKQLRQHMDTAEEACARPTPTPTVTVSPTPTPSPTPSESASPTPTLTPTPTPSPTPQPPLPPADLPACLAALRQVTATQEMVFGALSVGQQTLDAQTKALAEAAEAQAKAMAKAAKQQAEALAQAQAELLAQSTGAEEIGGGSAGSMKAQLAQDLVAITRAEQAVRKARSDLDGATLRAPITGVVGQIDFTENSVAAADSGVTIVGSGASEVTVRVPLSLMGKVTRGQSAQVIPPGATKPVQGKVTSVSLLPNASSPGSYDTVISVPRSPVALTTGVSATVRVEVASASDVPVVPMSATVPIDERQATVQVLGPSGIEERTVTTGIKGVTRIEVTNGLTVGQRLVIADPTRPLPSLDLFGPAEGEAEPAPEPS
ncbi:MAG: HlyD family efflux transporter periplasmic adaptor subunit [Microlunatus sp.]